MKLIWNLRWNHYPGSPNMPLHFMLCASPANKDTHRIRGSAFTSTFAFQTESSVRGNDGHHLSKVWEVIEKRMWFKALIMTLAIPFKINWFHADLAGAPSGSRITDTDSIGFEIWIPLATHLWRWNILKLNVSLDGKLLRLAITRSPSPGIAIIDNNCLLRVH